MYMIAALDSVLSHPLSLLSCFAGMKPLCQTRRLVRRFPFAIPKLMCPNRICGNIGAAIEAFVPGVSAISSIHRGQAPSNLGAVKGIIKGHRKSLNKQTPSNSPKAEAFLG